MAASAETLIFLDVDGVLNVGVQDGLDTFAFTSENLQLALKMAAAPETSDIHPVAELILEVASHKLGHGENATYEKLIAHDDNLSDLLVSRFVKLLQAAGSSYHVVLSSSWRRPGLTKQKQRLEAYIAKHLGKPFAFEASTSLREEQTPMDRLQIIGEYAVDFCKQRGSDASPALRILVLEDFDNTALSGQDCQGFCIDSPEAAERYLAELIGTDSGVKVKVVHTYDSWTTDKGTPIAVGCGLTMEHFGVGLDFFITEKVYQTHAHFTSIADSLLAPFKTIDGASSDLGALNVIARLLACVLGTCSPFRPQYS